MCASTTGILHSTLTIYDFLVTMQSRYDSTICFHAKEDNHMEQMNVCLSTVLH